MRRRSSYWSLVAAVLVGPWLGEEAARGEIQGTSWLPIGPAPLQGSYGGKVTGRASAVAVNEKNPDDVWLGTAAGGVWHSTDGGLSWVPTSDREKSLAIGALALDDCLAAGCATIYASTGENAIRRDTYYGSGLLVGTMAGGTAPRLVWALRDGTPKYNFQGGSINNVVLDPKTAGSAKRLYITLSSGVTVSSSEATVTAPEPSGGYGLYESEDQGKTWSKLTVPGAEGAKPTDLEMDPADSNVLYAGFMGRGIFRGSRNPADGTITWCPFNPGIAKAPSCPSATGLPDPATTPFDHVEIALFPGTSTATTVLYAVLGQCPDPLFENCVPAIYRSTDGGSSWDLRLAGDSNHEPYTAEGYPSPGRVYSRYTHGLAVDPKNKDTIYLSGLRLWKSINGGQIFMPADINSASASDPSITKLHHDHHAVIFHPTDSLRVYETSDGGFAFSKDGGDTWTPGNSGLQIVGFQSLASSPLTGTILTGSQDNSGVTWDGGVWQYRGCCGDGGFTVMDRDDVMTMYAGDSLSFLRRSTDGGSTWKARGVSDPRLLFFPFVHDPTAPHPLYLGANRLFRSDNRGDDWTPVSPVLATGSQPEIMTNTPGGGVNVITAIAVAPSNPDRIYVGYYGGELFVTDGACADLSCWTPVSTGLPDAPVTRIAVDPLMPDVAYATFSGFGSAAHAWKTVDHGAKWSAVVAGLPPGIPANTVSIEPSTPANLWLGLDSGPDGSSLYKSTNGGATWESFSDGLPNAPVYEIAIDEIHSRVYAATHGRGAFVLGKPFLTNFEGWVDGDIWDIPVYGHNFLPGQDCTLRILQASGNVCAEGKVDVMGGTIKTNADGVLTTSKDTYWDGKPVAWACFSGTCVGGTPIASCNVNKDGRPDPLTTVLVACGGELAVDNVIGCPPLANPPSTLLGLGLAGLAKSKAAAGDRFFELTASVQALSTTRSLCTATVSFQPGETAAQVLTRARTALNAKPACAATTVSAALEGLDVEGGEDQVAGDPRLRIAAPGVVGGLLITSLHAAPGRASGVCFTLSGLDVPVLKQLRVMKLTLETRVNGAAGGSVTVRERSGLGTCSITVPTTAGEDGADIAAALRDAFQAPGIPGPNPDCPAAENPRDVSARGATLRDSSLTTVLASTLEVCSDDPGVGFSLRPEELAHAHPTADAGADQTLVVHGSAPIPVQLDGTGSSDPDSTPGTNDDIVSFQWFRLLPDGTRAVLATGALPVIGLGPGTYRIVLRIEDRQGLADEDETIVTVFLRDCNANGIDDAIDVANGTSQDLNANGQPDECGFVNLVWSFRGVAQGGQVSAIIAGFSATCMVTVTTAAGETPETVVANFAAAVQADPCLAGQGITAVVEGRTLRIRGFLIREINTTITDPGLHHDVPLISIPTLLEPGLLVLVVLLALAGIRLLRR